MKQDQRKKHHTVEQRIKVRSARLRSLGRSENQASEMLDLYLGGDSVREIAEAYELSLQSVYVSMSKEALFRLMRDRQVERLEEVKEIVDGDTK